MDRINKMVQRNLDKMKSKTKKMNRNFNKQYMDITDLEEQMYKYKKNRKYY
jgi:hypothetical protein